MSSGDGAANGDCTFLGPMFRFRNRACGNGNSRSSKLCTSWTGCLTRGLAARCVWEMGVLSWDFVGLATETIFGSSSNRGESTTGSSWLDNDCCLRRLAATCVFGCSLRGSVQFKCEEVSCNREARFQPPGLTAFNGFVTLGESRARASDFVRVETIRAADSDFVDRCGDQDGVSFSA